MSDLHRRPLLDVAASLRRGEVTSVEVVEHLLDRIAAVDERLHSYITVDATGALAAARRADAERAAGHDRGPLHGIPVAVKDNLATAQLRTTYNSRSMADAVPAVDEPAVARLRVAGAVILGKTNLNEFGWSLPSDADLCPPVRNPWQPELASVGSSSGSAAAVAAGLACAALGTDGGGSTRLPAGQHGQVGLKPTRGAVPREASFVTDLSVVGILARNADDAAALHDAVADRPVGPLGTSIRDLRLGVPRALMDEVAVEDEVRAGFEESVAVLRDLGVHVEDIELPELTMARAAAFVLITTGGFADHEDELHARLDLIGPVTRRYMLTGVFASGADVLRAQRVRELVTAALATRLAGVDGILSPVSPVITAEAARIPGEHRKGRNAAFTSPFNLTGWPAVAIPSHVSSYGLPIGFQIAGRPGQERTLLDAAKAYGAVTGVQDLCAPI